MTKKLTIQLSDELEQRLAQRATQLNLSPETFILQTLTRSLELPQDRQTQPTQWPEEILHFTGIPDLIPFEDNREELLPPEVAELF
ncbi:hypothetical protein AY599_10055 [Leptolyngbya valderiana BDU 20041]|uniref:hypothetical protein n=1 Tax=Baaleninema simplex TaxID=2862350 RepID=UPI000348E514|nr:hypothetical protein [Baaleninema simplex]MDC0831644.1 hypothetical protein [Geitlerinema sp. CS-897]OAB60630.1 hypothetical protein AY599_10055 [Leptolyngbya valderiana BDU 20041]